MIDVMYAMTESSVRNFVQFKTDLEKLKSTATLDQIDKVKAAVTEMQLSTGQSFSIDEDTGTAIIPVMGTLTPKPEICVSLSDGSQTLYPSIVESIKIAESMPSVNKIRIEFDTPGGFVQGVESAALAIKQAKKPTIGVVMHQACSAGFWLLSQCDHKIAATPLAQVGSIGVIVEAIDRKKMDKDMGIERVILTSKNAPEKFQDIGTKEGQNKIIDRMTKIESVFIDRVADGFGVSTETVKKDFGQGGVLIAKDAIEVGMLEKIDENSMNSVDSVNNGNIQAEEINLKTKKGVSMNLNELLSQNPEAKAEFEASISAAVSKDRTRVNKLMSLSGVIIPDELKAAINDGTQSGVYAESQLESINKVRKNVSNVSDLGKIEAGAQTPKESVVEKDVKKNLPEGAITSEEEAKAAAKKFYGDES